MPVLAAILGPLSVLYYEPILLKHFYGGPPVAVVKLSVLYYEPILLKRPACHLHRRTQSRLSVLYYEPILLKPRRTGSRFPKT